MPRTMCGMCGIVGYVGPRESQPILIAGLSRLEYRGYDSAGIAVIDAEGHLVVYDHNHVTRKYSERLARLIAERAGF